MAPSRPLLWLLLTCSVSGCAGEEPPQVPDLPELAGADPELVTGVDRRRARVVEAPSDVEAWRELARVLDANGLDPAAETAWEAVTQLAPGDATAWYLLARVRGRLGERAGELAALETSLQLEEYAPALARLGRLLAEEGREVEARAALERAILLQPESPRGPIGLARLSLSAGDASEVVRLLEPVAQRYPTEPQVHGLLARAFERLGDRERARQHRVAEERATLTTAPDPRVAALRDYELGLLARIERANAALSEGDAAGALTVLEPLRARLDEEPVLLAWADACLALGRASEARELLVPGRERLGERPRLLFLLARAERDLGEPARALEAVESARAANPRDAEAHRLAGLVLTDLGRFEEAAAALRAAREAGDASFAALLWLARALNRSARPVEALDVLDAAAESFSFAPKLWAERAEALLALGRTGDARAALDEARERGLEPEVAEDLEARLAEAAREDAD